MLVVYKAFPTSEENSVEGVGTTLGLIQRLKHRQLSCTWLSAMATLLKASTEKN